MSYSNAYLLNPESHHAPLSPYTHLSVLPGSTDPTYSQLFQPSASGCASAMDRAAPLLYENPHAHGMSANPAYSQLFQPSAPGPASTMGQVAPSLYENPHHGTGFMRHLISRVPP